MSRNNIAVVSYLNTLPFVFGLEHESFNFRDDLLLDIPAKCYTNFNLEKADIALIPAADLLKLDSQFNIITPFCIGAKNSVRSVILASNYKLEDIKTIYLDTHSHTSRELVKILASDLWKIDPQWKDIKSFEDIDTNEKGSAYMLIGDKVFHFEKLFSTIYDLASEWNRLTSLPFAFAVWVARPSVSTKRIELLTEALTYGINNIEKAVELSIHNKNREESIKYLTKNIDYDFDEDKRKALKLFLRRISPLPESLSNL